MSDEKNGDDVANEGVRATTRTAAAEAAAPNRNDTALNEGDVAVASANSGFAAPAFADASTSPLRQGDNENNRSALKAERFELSSAVGSSSDAARTPEMDTAGRSTATRRRRPPPPPPNIAVGITAAAAAAQVNGTRGVSEPAVDHSLSSSYLHTAGNTPPASVSPSRRAAGGGVGKMSRRRRPTTMQSSPQAAGSEDRGGGRGGGSVGVREIPSRVHEPLETTADKDSFDRIAAVQRSSNGGIRSSSISRTRSGRGNNALATSEAVQSATAASRLKSPSSSQRRVDISHQLGTAPITRPTSGATSPSNPPPSPRVKITPVRQLAHQQLAHQQLQHASGQMQSTAAAGTTVAASSSSATSALIAEEVRRQLVQMRLQQSKEADVTRQSPSPSQRRPTSATAATAAATATVTPASTARQRPASASASVTPSSSAYRGLGKHTAAAHSPTHAASTISSLSGSLLHEDTAEAVSRLERRFSSPSVAKPHPVSRGPAAAAAAASSYSADVMPSTPAPSSRHDGFSQRPMDAAHSISASPSSRQQQRQQQQSSRPLTSSLDQLA